MDLTDFHPSHFMADPGHVRSIQRRFLRYFPEKGRVADLGCGVGVFLDLLRESGRTGCGVDSFAEYIDLCRSRGHEAYCEDIFTFLRSRPGQFDGVIGSHIIEHFHPKEGMDLLVGMRDLLRPGGILFLMTPSYHDLLVSSERFWLDMSHIRPYPLPILDAMLSHLGMTIVDKGYDPKTRVRPAIYHPRSFYRYWMAKLRFGKYYDVGDTFIVARKEAGG
ncbi:MAG TPA: class I SAM-dependent methyltransferase [Bacteroidota bacterium]|nr:class I SAM-dependent methyltransferase [Bacteroidota bacterium]